jgi:hypothetical protein
MNKTIYMTYKKDIPDFVYLRWKNLNKEYNIDFSLDCDCIDFLKTHFNDYIANLFQKIPQGMYKADLWRLCKLYVCGGVYADVDLVPYLNIDIELDNNISFYSCLSATRDSVFQAFMICNKPKNPLILQFIISFLLNNAYSLHNGPCYDMYNCILYNLNNIKINSETKYEINEIKIFVNIGPSETNTKCIDLHFFPNDITYNIKLNENQYNDTFLFTIDNNFLIVKRTDKNTGWGFNHSIDIRINSYESIFLFTETLEENKHYTEAYVSLDKKKILDSRDSEYSKNKGW